MKQSLLNDHERRVNSKTFVCSTTQVRSHVVSSTIFYRRKSLLTNPDFSRRDKKSQKQTHEVSQLRSRVFETTQRTFSVRQPTVGASTQWRQPTKRISEFVLQSPEELVWRRALRRQLELSETPQTVQDVANSVPRPSVQKVSFEESTVSVPQVSEKAVAGPITKLDAALVDRLAEDVIRRIEKRARIERQRRGL